MPDDSVLNFSKAGGGKVYYDVTMTYRIPAKDVAARDEGFLVRTESYDLSEFRRIDALKKEEYAKFEAGKIRHSDLKYPKGAYEYLEPLKKSRVGQLVLVRYRLVLPEARDRVAFETFVPAGAEVVNTRLATESKSVSEDTFFSREEFLDDRYFGYSESLSAGDYE